ncbi:MAG: glycosyltransferase [Acidobacteriota bacterium]|nr:glycosyltransferase [Acidobacteriota bacterium]
MNAVKRVLILTLSVGSGHVQASSVIKDALADGLEAVEVRTLDAIDLAEPWFPWLYVQPYWWMLRYRRELWRAIYERRQHKRHRSTAPDWVFRYGCAKVLAELRSFAPHLVIVTEIAAAEIAALAKREGCFSSPIHAVLTDFHAEPPWVQPEIDFYSVATEQAKAQLISWGVSPHRILISGIPINPAFALPYEKEEARGALGLKPKSPVVLLMAGGMGMAPLDLIASSLERCGLPLQTIAVAGHDQALYERLQGLRGKIALDLSSFAWTDRIPELMAAADLIITKPGGLTVSEALASGLPMILTHPIPGPEERNGRYLVQHRVAIHAKTIDEIPSLTVSLLRHPEKREAMSRLARELARPEAGHAIAQVGRAMLEKETYIDLLAPPPTGAGDSAFVM